LLYRFHTAEDHARGLCNRGTLQVSTVEKWATTPAPHGDRLEGVRTAFRVDRVVTGDKGHRIGDAESLSALERAEAERFIKIGAVSNAIIAGNEFREHSIPACWGVSFTLYEWTTSEARDRQRPWGVRLDRIQSLVHHIGAAVGRATGCDNSIAHGPVQYGGEWEQVTPIESLFRKRVDPFAEEQEYRLIILPKEKIEVAPLLLDIQAIARLCSPVRRDRKQEP
jgi:hypothetical protein